MTPAARGPQADPAPNVPATGTPAVFAVTYTALAGSLYFTLGVVAKHALGLTPVVFLVAAVLFGLAAMTYLEGVARHQSTAGSTVFARHGFNELVSFVAGWAVLLDYTILIAVTALSATNYLQAFWEPIGHGTTEGVATLAIIGYVAVRNMRGFGTGRGRWIRRLVAADAVLLTLLVVAGLALLWNPDALTKGVELGSTPTWGGLMFALGVATIVFTGLESATSLAGEIDTEGRALKRLAQSVTATLILVYVGTAVVAVMAVPAAGGAESLAGGHLDAPILGVAAAFGGTFGEWLGYAFAVVAAATLVAAANSAMLGLSRLAYQLSRHRQIPSALGRLHSSRATPIVAIVLAALLAIALVLPQNLELLVSIYAFGALLAITIAHASLVAMRRRDRDGEPGGRDVRPVYRAPLSLPVRGVSLPLTAVAGGIASLGIWIALLVTHSGARWVGFGWMAAGLLLYVGYRTLEGLPLLRMVTVPETALRREGRTLEYGSILVPLTGTEIDVDMVQTAGRFASERARRDSADEPTTIEVVWPLEVPMSLPIDARMPDEQVAHARERLRQAKAVGEEYNGVEVATAIVRGRRAGAVIVDEARRRGVEVIVMSAEEPSRIRGGAVLGGLAGGRENYVGEMTKYVLAKAPCQVILTAPVTAESQARADQVAAELAAMRREQRSTARRYGAR